MELSGRVAVVKVALRNRERLAILRPRDGVLVLQTMLWPDEVRRPELGFLDDSVTVRPQEMAMAQSYVETLAGEFDPTDYTDEYRQALEEVVEAKIQGREVTKPKEVVPEGGKVVDLMDALRRSVAEAKRSRGEDADAGEGPVGGRSSSRGTPAKTAAKKAPAKKAPARKAAAKSTTKKVAAKKTATRKSA